ncbi:helix-turn-helix transcriptional regulator [Dellaglioa algida]|uniref:helix-turn-helix transcriptional regulator n=1 Tax=Dellaglioa algida TaxID=105612 RepID=UPI0024C49057|nr:AraC family transcriptional regulator [Dellaglioa algida]MDK1727921.1 AraC family transcriptional regulator [Dellaglioa algida]MDK1735682.1 AraC family transcriptional regulator [Dellaglioa algida]MDK1737252.1 AraC family transcriptional regulator [Dellaglioa algida]
MFKINLEKPILHIWSGEYIGTPGKLIKHRSLTTAEDFEILIPFSGPMSIVVNDIPVTLTTGECLIVKPFSTISENALNTSPFSHFWIHFLVDYSIINSNDAFLKKGIIELSKQIKPNTLNNFIILPTKFHISNRPLIFQLCHQLLTISSSSHYTERSNDAITTLLLIALSNDFLTQQILKSDTKLANVESIAEWIRVNINAHITVQDVARKFEFNPSYLTRLFKENYGIGIKAYIIQSKLELSYYLLSTTLLPIAEVSEQSFFTDEKHFMHVFKKKLGITPTQYRNLFSNTHMNTLNVDPKSPIPTQFGTAALHNLIKAINTDNH